MKKRAFKPLILLLFISIFNFFSGIFIPAAAIDNSPMEELRRSVSRVLNVLNDTQSLKKGQTEVRCRKLKPLVQTAFDMRGISQQALGKDWYRFTADQQNEFTAVFSEYVSVAYLAQIDGEDVNFKVNFIDYRVDDKNNKIASVRTQVEWKFFIVDVDFDMCLKKEYWRIADVRIWSISLVQNWRSQFIDALRTLTPAELIDRMKKQIAEERYS